MLGGFTPMVDSAQSKNKRILQVADEGLMKKKRGAGKLQQARLFLKLGYKIILSLLCMGSHANKKFCKSRHTLRGKVFFRLAIYMF